MMKPQRTHTRGETCNLAGYSLAVLLSGLMAVQGGVIGTTGNSFDLSDPAAWEGGVVPGPGDTANITHDGKYTAHSSLELNFGGMTFEAPDVEIVAQKDLPFTILLGTGGIGGDSQGQKRLGGGAGNGNWVLDTGVSNQTWSQNLILAAELAGSATIEVTGWVWLRSLKGNKNFAGTWLINGGSIRGHSNFGGPDITFQLKNRGVLAFQATTPQGGSYKLANARVEVLDEGELVFPGNGSEKNMEWILQYPTSGNGSLTLAVKDRHVENAAILYIESTFEHRGNTLIAGGVTSGKAPFQVKLTPNGSIKFHIGANGVNNAILESPDKEQSELLLDGFFILDLSHAQVANGNSWKLVDQNLDSITYGSNFQVQGFKKTGTTWTRTESGTTWTFDQSTGVLKVGS